MRRLAHLLAVVCLCAVPSLCTLQTVAQNPADMKTLPQAELDCVKVLLAQERAWNSGDMNGYLAGYKNSPDVLFIGGDIARGFEALATRYRKSYPDKGSMGTLTFSDLQPELAGADHVAIVGRYQLDRTKKAGGPASGIFSLVFEKTPDGWKIILDHTT